MDDSAHSTNGPDRRQFWVNTETGEIEEGRQSPAVHRMGPYASREAAKHAFQKAERRTQAWDEADRRWKGDGD